MTLLSLVVALILVGVLLYVVNLIPLDPTIKKLIQIVVIVFVALWLLSALFGGVSLPSIQLK